MADARFFSCGMTSMKSCFFFRLVIRTPPPSV